MAWSVYILRCADGTFYTGVTTNVPRRVSEHNTDPRLAAAYTRSRRPVELVYEERLPNRAAACRREAVIKKLTRQQKQQLFRAG